MSDNIFNAPYTAPPVEDYHVAWLRRTFTELNAEHFDGKLVMPAWENCLIAGVGGFYTAINNTIAVDYRLIDVWTEGAREVLLHEMVHEYTQPEHSRRARNDYMAQFEMLATGGHTELWKEEARKRGLRSIPSMPLKDAKYYANLLITKGMVRGPEEDTTLREILNTEDKSNAIPTVVAPSNHDK